MRAGSPGTKTAGQWVSAGETEEAEEVEKTEEAEETEESAGRVVDAAMSEVLKLD
ncbi:hypothetical protein GCM10010280_36270 [Streptomyces pilosus]|uniref:Uncharacterized protein n=1 Tax=Streptomyces pilosus TaxID=28893 RepID=A0A918BSD4_9ACTN|nr:hypothetical protein GCM10010280_36270 [Streptomyces pilosus]